jgi:predicted glycosyltransferase
VPDYEDISESLAGELSHPNKMPRNVKYIGVLSRFSKRCTSDTCLQNRITPYRTSSWRENIITDLALAILSGAEPQRTMLEEELLTLLQDDPHENIILVQGKIEAEQKVSKVGKVTVCNYMSTEELQEYILKADKIICRSGYSSIMDLHALGKLQNATLIPTPGQTEQEYLAEYISNHIK